MIKLIFTSAILVGSLFFFQTSLVRSNQSEAAITSVKTPVPVTLMEMEQACQKVRTCVEDPKITVQNMEGCIEITIKSGSKTKVIRQYYNCNT